MPAEPAPRKTMRWSFSSPPATLIAPDDRAQGHRGGALDVVVEGEQLVPVALQDRRCVGSCEVLPLQADVGQLLLDRLDEAVDEVVVVLAGDPLVPPAEVLRIGDALRVVRCRRRARSAAS